jgi:hypothetical protein
MAEVVIRRDTDPQDRTGLLNFPLSLDNGRSPHAYINQRLHIQFRTPDDERCAARNILSIQ